VPLSPRPDPLSLESDVAPPTNATPSSTSSTARRSLVGPPLRAAASRHLGGRASNDPASAGPRYIAAFAPRRRRGRSTTLIALKPPAGPRPVPPILAAAATGFLFLDRDNSRPPRFGRGLSRPKQAAFHGDSQVPPWGVSRRRRRDISVSRLEQPGPTLVPVATLGPHEIFPPPGAALHFDLARPQSVVEVPGKPTRDLTSRAP